MKFYFHDFTVGQIIIFCLTTDSALAHAAQSEDPQSDVSSDYCSTERSSYLGPVSGAIPTAKVSSFGSAPNLSTIASYHDDFKSPKATTVDDLLEKRSRSILPQSDI